MLITTCRRPPRLDPQRPTRNHLMPAAPANLALPGTNSALTRRELLRAGLGGFASLSLPGLFRLRAEAADSARRERTAVILVWLRGGASHLETYDPKPGAPSDYRGPYGAIATRTPGLRLGELLPRHARVSHRFAILRS